MISIQPFKFGGRAVMALNTEDIEWLCVDLDLDKFAKDRFASVSCAVRSIIFSSFVFAGGEVDAHEALSDPHWQPAVAQCLGAGKSGIGRDPTTHDSGGWCTPAGCYIWADTDDPPGGSGSGGGGGGGTGSTGSGGPPPDPPVVPPSALPDPEHVTCAANQYGRYTERYPWGISNVWAFAKGTAEMFSVMTPIPPPGFVEDYAVTKIGSDWPAGGQTILYGAGLTAHSDSFTYVDPVTKSTVVVPGPFTAFEWTLITLAHEFAHQNGIDSEDEAEKYGTSVLKAYRTDSGKKCP